jgi:predicted nucleic-acid-binding Zn-ribbon protein
MKIFNFYKNECPKCGGRLNTKYFDGAAQLEKQRDMGLLQGSGLNYLIKTCVNCGFEGREEPKDAK